jgi:GMP synthase (glutamine-hydrolysing)
MSHGDQVTQLPTGFKTIASSHNCKYAAMENATKKIFGVQFHPEVKNSIHGKTIIRNFIFNVCKIKPN